MRTLTTPEKIVGGAAVVTAVAAFLPWASILGFSKSGIDGDGQITVVLALIGIALVATGQLRRRRIGYLQAVLGAFVTFVGIADMTSVSAIGLYLTLFAGIAWTIGAVMALRAPQAV
jgi:hypothetical protein